MCNRIGCRKEYDRDMFLEKKISIDEIRHYFPAIKNFLDNKNLKKIDCGHYELEDGIWANVDIYNTQTRNKTHFESHRKYLDLQWVIQGSEIIEVCDIQYLLPNRRYCIEKDIQLYHSSEGVEYVIKEGEGILLYPMNAHRPCIAVNETLLSEVKKIVFKIPICYSKSVKCIFMDTDGTLTDGKIYVGAKGEYVKAFDVKDGYAIKSILPKYGILPCVITGRESEILANRCSELGVTELYQNVDDKKKVIRKVAERYNFDFSELVYIGDDANDSECMQMIKSAGGITACPKDSAEDVLALANYISVRNGGNGVVREVIDWLTASVKIQYVAEYMD